MRIELGIIAEDLIDGGHLIGKLGRAEIVPADLLEVAAASGHAAVIDVEDRESMLGEELVKEEMFTAPAIARRAHPRAAIGVHDEGNAVGRGIARRQQQGSIEFGGFVGGGEFERLGSDEAMAFEGMGIPDGGTHHAR